MALNCLRKMQFRPTTHGRQLLVNDNYAVSSTLILVPLNH